MKYYCNRLFRKKMRNAQIRTSTKYLYFQKCQTPDIEIYNEEGFEAYSVNSDTYESVQEELETDLTELGVESEYSYIIVLDAAGEGSGDAQARASYGSSFNYTYNGTTYSLRRVTIYTSDDPKMYKNSKVDLLQSASINLINNCLNTAIYAYIDFLSGPLHLGTVAGICGLSIANFGTGGTSRLELNGATTWTRKYTQVWNNYDQRWASGSSVEDVQATSWMTGSYYDAHTNSTQLVPQNKSTKKLYSNNYSNTTWQNQYAIVGYLNSYIQFDTVGTVKYSYGGTVKITHYENF